MAAWRTGPLQHGARANDCRREDAKRPNRERECLVKDRTRLVNRMKGTLARLGIRNFNPTLRQAAERLATLQVFASFSPRWTTSAAPSDRYLISIIYLD